VFDSKELCLAAPTDKNSYLQVEVRVSWSTHPSTRKNGISARLGFTPRIIKVRNSNLVQKTGYILTKVLLKAVP
jgi:hypothetical protein